jgi:hypothetical protein
MVQRLPPQAKLPAGPGGAEHPHLAQTNNCKNARAKGPGEGQGLGRAFNKRGRRLLGCARYGVQINRTSHQLKIQELRRSLTGDGGPVEVKACGQVRPTALVRNYADGRRVMLTGKAELC